MLVRCLHTIIQYWERIVAFVIWDWEIGQEAEGACTGHGVLSWATGKKLPIEIDNKLIRRTKWSAPAPEQVRHYDYIQWCNPAG